MVARRLRYLYRESRDMMDFAMRGAALTASVYGNPSLDASKGYKAIVERFDRARDLVFYLHPRRNGLPDIDRSVALFNAIRKNITKDMAMKAYKAMNPETEAQGHILGGGRPRPEH